MPRERPRRPLGGGRALGVIDGPDLGRLQRGETVPGRTGPVHPDQVVGPDRAGRIVTVLGDTTRCAASVSLARDADLVVHECTYANRDAANNTTCDPGRVDLKCAVDWNPSYRAVINQPGRRYRVDDINQYNGSANLQFYW